MKLETRLIGATLVKDTETGRRVLIAEYWDTGCDAREKAVERLYGAADRANLRLGLWRDGITSRGCLKVSAQVLERMSDGKPVVGSEPDCICNGDTVTLWDCECRECRELAWTGCECGSEDCSYCGE